MDQDAKPSESFRDAALSSFKRTRSHWPQQNTNGLEPRASPRRARGPSFLVGLGVSLWSANAAMKSLFDTLNIVYGEDEKRGFVKLNAISLLFTVGGILFVVAALGAIVVIPVSLWPSSTVTGRAARRRGGGGSPGARSGRHPVALDLGAVLLVRVQFGKFNETYGSLGRLSASCGFPRSSSCWAAPNSTPREHQTARDTTTGSPKPMGACGHD